jgi:branched-chain amino acid transport system substrate-binding protein
VSRDDAFNPDKTAENTKALIDQNALALVGYRGTANVQKIVPLQAAGIAEIGNTSGARSLRDPHVPRPVPRARQHHRRDRGGGQPRLDDRHQKIAAAYQDDAFGKEGLDALNASLKKRGATPAPWPRCRAARWTWPRRST